MRMHQIKLYDSLFTRQEVFICGPFDSLPRQALSHQLGLIWNTGQVQRGRGKRSTTGIVRGLPSAWPHSSKWSCGRFLKLPLPQRRSRERRRMRNTKHRSTIRLSSWMKVELFEWKGQEKYDGGSEENLEHFQVHIINWEKVEYCHFFRGFKS
jgi:hypothetical protein